MVGSRLAFAAWMISLAMRRGLAAGIARKASASLSAFKAWMISSPRVRRSISAMPSFGAASLAAATPVWANRRAGRTSSKLCGLSAPPLSSSSRLPDSSGVLEGHAGRVASRLSQARHQPGGHWIAGRDENDRQISGYLAR